MASKTFGVPSSSRTGSSLTPPPLLARSPSVFPSPSRQRATYMKHMEVDNDKQEESAFGRKSYVFVQNLTVADCPIAFDSTLS
jgi:hypothetical protein